MTTRATVVVPTRDRPESLARCLDALRVQIPDRRLHVDPIDVLVVDDASADAAAVRAAVAGRARLVRGEGLGPAAARNLGARNAEADVVLFTDDDCRPDPGWAAALLARIGAGAAAAAGPTWVGTGARSPARAAQVVTNHLVTASAAPGVVGFAPTSNLAGPAETFATLPFDEGYPSAAGEDRDWCDRFAATGSAIAYEPNAVVRHHPDLSVRRYWRQQVRYGRGARRFRATGDRTRPPPAFYASLLRAGFREGITVGTLVGVAQAATAVGFVGEVCAERRRPT